METYLDNEGYKRRNSHHKTDNKSKEKEYINEKGYPIQKPEHSNLKHRQIAYKHIYLKNRDLYPLPFSMYVIHHKDGNKLNYRISNLELLSKEDHEELHGIRKKRSKFSYFLDKPEWSLGGVFGRWLASFIVVWFLVFFIVDKVYLLRTAGDKIMLIILIICCSGVILMWFVEIRDLILNMCEEYTLSNFVKQPLIIEFVVIIGLILLLKWLF